MSPIIAALYLLCMVFLTAFGGYVLAPHPNGRANRSFAWLALALLGWVGTLFAFSLIVSRGPLLLVGRLNFAAMALVIVLAYRFARNVAGHAAPRFDVAFLIGGVVAAVSAFTPWIDLSESISAAGVHVTVYGALFPVYVVHVLGFLAAALAAAFLPSPGTTRQRRFQMAAVGCGILATASVSLVTNLLLPYAFGDFALIHVGTISTILFLLASGYAVFAFHLFDIQVVVRAAFVYAGLIALALELYSLSLSFLAKLLPLGGAGERETAATAIVIVVNAFTAEPLRRYLERTISRVARRRRKL